MHFTVKKMTEIKSKINEIFEEKQLKINEPEIVAVSKTFTSSMISPLLDYGHVHFGENKLQEAVSKWSDLKKKYPKTKLHYLGKIQSNKLKKIVQLFDYLHSLDNKKTAEQLNKYQKEEKRNLKIFIQINLGQEKQKSGIMLSDLKEFYNYCNTELSLNIIGLMCIPPIDDNSAKYFEKLKLAANNLNLKDLSMGMSDDYSQAIIYNSTFLRIGSAIFGSREN